MAYAPFVGAIQDDFIKDPNLGRIELDSRALLLHSYQMEMSSLTFQMLQSGKYDLIFCNEHRNTEHLH